MTDTGVSGQTHLLLTSTPSPTLAHQHGPELHAAGELQTSPKAQGLLQVLLTGLGYPCRGRGQGLAHGQQWEKGATLVLSHEPPVLSPQDAGQASPSPFNTEAQQGAVIGPRSRARLEPYPM